MQINDIKINFINFQGGLTKKIQSEILSSNVKQISDVFIKNGIKTDFKDNKIIAWCALQCLNLFNKLELSLPKEIYVEDFDKLNVIPESVGFHNIAPVALYKNDSKLTNSNVIFFNEFPNENYWENLDSITDENYNANFTPTNFFLEPILHEFCHAAHFGNMLKHSSKEKILKYYQKTLSIMNIGLFKYKYIDIFYDKLCSYSISSPPEIIACDLSKRIIQNTDDSINLKENFIKISPYKSLNLLEKIFGLKGLLLNYDDIIRRIWFGKDV